MTSGSSPYHTSKGTVYRSVLRGGEASEQRTLFLSKRGVRRTPLVCTLSNCSYPIFAPFHNISTPFSAILLFNLKKDKIALPFHCVELLCSLIVHLHLLLCQPYRLLVASWVFWRALSRYCRILVVVFYTAAVTVGVTKGSATNNYS